MDISSWHNYYKNPENVNSFLNEPQTIKCYDGNTNIQKFRGTIQINAIYPRVSLLGEFYAKCKIQSISNKKFDDINDDNDIEDEESSTSSSSEDEDNISQLLIPRSYFDNMTKICPMEEEVFRLQGSTLKNVILCRDNQRNNPKSLELYKDIIILYPIQIISDKQCIQTRVKIDALPWENYNSSSMLLENQSTYFMNTEYSTIEYILRKPPISGNRYDKDKKILKNSVFYLKPFPPIIDPTLYVELYDHIINLKIKQQQEMGIDKKDQSEITKLKLVYMQSIIFDSTMTLKSMESRRSEFDSNFFSL